MSVRACRQLAQCFACCGLALIVLNSSGCSSSKESGSEKGAAEKPGQVSLPASETVGGEKTGEAAPVFVDKTPRPKFVETTTVTELFPDKSPKVVRGVKRFSDNSLVNHGHYIGYYANGKKFQEGNYLDNRKQGPWHVWHENGKEAMVENFLEGKPDGHWVVFDDNGLSEREVSYKNGQRNGRWIYYFAGEKQPSKQEEYRDDKLNGDTVTWYSNGEKAGQFQFEQGLPTGLQQEWFENGQIAKQVEYIKGKPAHVVQWTAEGKKILDEEHADGKTVAKPQKQ